MSTLLAHQRKVKKTRKIIARLNMVRLSVHRTPRHIYAQIIATDGTVLASASSLEKIVREDNNIKANKGKIETAKLVGKLIAERGKEKVDRIAFDRSGFKYHGRIKALADSAREFGLNF
ncbi:MAG: 50S ribosomal protein L18 [Gammaproteobacteria bacterium]|jgi:large subunit ribosomal protein L18